VVTGSRDQTERTDTPSLCESVQANLPLVKLSGNHRHLDAYAKPGRGSKSNSLAIPFALFASSRLDSGSDSARRR